MSPGAVADKDVTGGASSSLESRPGAGSALPPSAVALFAAVDAARVKLAYEHEQLVLLLRVALAALAQDNRGLVAHNLAEALRLLGAEALPLPEALEGRSLGAIVLPLSLSDQEVRKRYAQVILHSLGGNRTAAARALQISRRSMYKLIPAPPAPLAGEAGEAGEEGQPCAR